MFLDNQKEVAYMRNFICPQSKIEPLARQLKLIENQNYTGIPRFTLLMWGHKKKTAESENRVNRVYLEVLKGWENRIEL